MVKTILFQYRFRVAFFSRHQIYKSISVRNLLVTELSYLHATGTCILKKIYAWTVFESSNILKTFLHGVFLLICYLVSVIKQ